MQSLSHMDPAEYRAAKARSGIAVADIWCAVNKMTRDQDKSYSSGRTQIPEGTAQGIRKLLDKLSERGRLLAENVAAALPESTVTFDDSSGAISVTFASKKTLQIDCAGVDTLNLAPVYVAARSTRNEATFIYFSDASGAKPASIKGNQWFLWRGNFPENRSVGRLQNYFNEIDGENLSLALSAYA